MRLLIINPNRSLTVTERIRESAEAIRRPGDVFTTVGASFGPELIVTEEDNAQAVAAVLERVRELGGQVDGIVLASFGNTGLEEVRGEIDCPVIGIAQAAYCTAAAVTGRFAIVTISPRLVEGLQHSVEASGLQAQLAGILSLDEVSAMDPAAVQQERFAELQALCRQAARWPGVGCIIPGGGPLAGVAARLRVDSPIPVIDGTQCAIHLLRSSLSIADV